MFWSKGENRVEQTCRLLSHVWISGKRGALSLPNIKIASFPAMTLSHEFSTSPTTSSSPPSRTQQLFKWSTTGYIQCRYECLQICAKKGIKKMSQERWDKKKHDIAHSSCCMFWAFEFCRAKLRLNIPLVLPHLTRPDQVLTQWHETFSSITHFHKTKLGDVEWNQSKKGEQIMAIFQCGVWRQLFGSIWTCRITYYVFRYHQNYNY